MDILFRGDCPHRLAYLLRVLGTLLAAIVVGSLTGRWRRRWGQVALWIIGIISLVVFVLWLPVVSYFGKGLG